MMNIPDRFKGWFLQNKLNALKIRNVEIIEENKYVRSTVRCAHCGKLYVPYDLLNLAQCGIPPILANNWCSSKCYNDTQGLVIQ